jgi:hypothetical protein
MESKLAVNTRANSPSILLQLAENFPSAGAVILYPPAGGSVEVAYFGRTGNTLYDLAWPSSLESLEDADGVVNPVLPADTRVQVMLEYRDQVLNPAFVSLVRKRTERDYSTVSGTAAISDQDADEFYALLKSSSSVLETKAVNRPQALLKTLVDTLPPGSTLVVRSKHVIVDEMSPSTMETGPVADHVFQHGSIILTITSPDGTVVSGRLSLAATAQECVVQANAVGADTFAWRIRAIHGSAATLRILDPTGQSTRIEGLQGGGEYYVTVEVGSNLGYKKQATIVVAVGG